jgi:hypothetical protein
LFKVAKLYYGQRPTKVYNVAAHYGHQILYTPPYWPEFQPIEEIWGLIKNFVANNREDFSMNEADRLLTVGHTKINSTIWTNTIARVQRYENQFSWDNNVPNVDQTYIDEFEEPEDMVEIYMIHHQNQAKKILKL